MKDRIDNIELLNEALDSLSKEFDNISKFKATVNEFGYTPSLSYLLNKDNELNKYFKMDLPSTDELAKMNATELNLLSNAIEDASNGIISKIKGFVGKIIDKLKGSKSNKNNSISIPELYNSISNNPDKLNLNNQLEFKMPDLVFILNTKAKDLNIIQKKFDTIFNLIDIDELDSGNDNISKKFNDFTKNFNKYMHELNEFSKSSIFKLFRYQMIGREVSILEGSNKNKISKMDILEFLNLLEDALKTIKFQLTDDEEFFPKLNAIEELASHLSKDESHEPYKIIIQLTQYMISFYKMVNGSIENLETTINDSVKAIKTNIFK